MIAKKLQFQEKFVLYMDILGTKNLIKTQPEVLLDIIKNIASNNRQGEIKNKLADDGYFDNIKYEAEFSSFSDHMVISHAVDTPLALLSLIHIAIQIHSLLLERGVLVRGSITKGSLYHNGNIILGEALIKADYLEKNESNYPRVIIDNDIVDIFKSHINVGSIIQDKKDDKYFINYIDSPVILGFSEHEVVINAKNVMKVIENKVFDKNLNERAKSKWLWLAEEFNNFLDNPKKQEKYRTIKDIQCINLLLA